METFRKLFGSLLALVYHCFDRIVIQGYLPLLTREAHIVHFFRDVHGVYPITKPALQQRTKEYQHWVEAFARNHGVPLQWPEKDMKKKGLRQEDFVRPYLLAMERRKRFGVYFIFKVMEKGSRIDSACVSSVLGPLADISAEVDYRDGRDSERSSAARPLPNSHGSGDSTRWSKH